MSATRSRLEKTDGGKRTFAVQVEILGSIGEFQARRHPETDRVLRWTSECGARHSSHKDPPAGGHAHGDRGSSQR